MSPRRCAGATRKSKSELVTNQEGMVVLEQLAEQSGVSIEQFLEHSALTLALCVGAIKDNVAEGMFTPTRILFEQADGSYLALNLVEFVTQGIEQNTGRSFDVGIADPFSGEEGVPLPVSREARHDLARSSTYLRIPLRRALMEAIDMRFRVMQQAASNLGVLIESPTPDAYYEIPVSFVG